MEALFLTFAALALYALIGGAAHVAARALTAKPLINKRPFNCDACASLWLSFIIGAPFTLIAPTLVDAGALLSIAFINYFYLTTKITIND